MILPLFSMNFNSIFNVLSFGLYNNIKKDPTVLSLLFSNLLTILIAVLFNWNLIEVLWVYLGQSVIIGLFNFLKIIKISISQNTTAGFKVIGLFSSFFFLVHYNGFHFGYFLFLSMLSFIPGSSGNFVPMNILNFLPVFLITLFIFFINHLFSFIYYFKKIDVPTMNEKNILMGDLMFRPYARIIPMHFTIMFGTLIISLGNFNSFVLIFFLLLKTYADLKMHISEHKENF